MRMMIGFMPGPDSPPNLLPIAGRNVSVLILSPRIVFDTTNASAPARSAALATATTSPALGDNFTHIGLSVVARMSFTTLYVIRMLFVQGEVAAFGIARRTGNIDFEHVDRRL